MKRSHFTNHCSESTNPGFLVISPDLRCNNDCIFCYENYQERNSRGFSSADEVFQLTLDLVRKTGVRSVAISGGEPTLYPGLVDYVSLLKQEGIFVCLMTNGRSLRRETRLRRLLDAGVDHFHIPVHSDLEATHDSISRIQGSFRDTVTGLHNLDSAQTHAAVGLSIIHVMHKINVARLDHFARYITDFHPKHVLLSYCIVEVESPKEHFDLLVPFEQLMPQVVKAYDAFKAYGQKVYVENIPPCVMRGLEEICMDFHKFNLLEVEGLKAVSEGDTKTYRYLQQSIKSYQRTFAPQCQSCAIKPYCGGVYRSYADAQGVSEIVPYGVQEIRSRLAQTPSNETAAIP